MAQQDELKPPLRLRSKKDLYMCLALHMEKSPKCKKGIGFYETGIVVCESDKVHKVMAMCCSTENLHAVQQVMLKISITLCKCTIYLSRKPCSTCTKSLIQGGVSAVYYWPRHPELEGREDIVKNDLNIVDDLFLRSSTISSVFVPLDLDKGTILKLVERTMRYQCEEYKSNYEGTWKEDYNLNCNLLNLPDSKDICKRKMEIALQHLSDLLNCSHGEFEEHIHALQLCYLLATRSDDPHRGVGCVLYDGKGCFFAAGYNGYPIDVLYGNLPRKGVGKDAKKPSLVHAETNALLFRYKKNIEDEDVLYCTNTPCSDCQKYIELVGIKQFVAVEKGTVIKMVFEEKWQESVKWKCPLLKASDQKDSKSEEPEAGGEEKSAFRLEKRDMCLFLAIHMENSPFCKKPQGTVGPASKNFKFHKTGIVICEGDTFQRIIAMDCSSESLHAVQRVLLKLPNKVRGCNVFLSRKPCLDCVKFLVQAQVRSILFWPSSEIDISSISQKEDHSTMELINKILKESSTYDAMFVPLIETEMTNNPKIFSIFDETNPRIFELFGVPFSEQPKYQEACKKEIEKASNFFQKQIGYNARKLLENNNVSPKEYPEALYIQHALQLCNLLAARSDVSNKVGTVIYKGENIVAVGYSGYPRGTMNNLLVRKDEDRTVCAEANALIFRPEDDLRGAELITSKKPCLGCQRLIQEKGLKRFIYPESPSQLMERDVQGRDIQKWIGMPCLCVVAGVAVIFLVCLLFRC